MIKKALYPRHNNYDSNFCNVYTLKTVCTVVCSWVELYMYFNILWFDIDNHLFCLTLTYFLMRAVLCTIFDIIFFYELNPPESLIRRLNSFLCAFDFSAIFKFTHPAYILDSAESDFEIYSTGHRGVKKYFPLCVHAIRLWINASF